MGGSERYPTNRGKEAFSRCREGKGTRLNEGKKHLVGVGKGKRPD